MVSRLALISLLFPLINACSTAPDVIDKFYELRMEKRESYFSTLPIESQVRIFVWDMENMHPSDLGIGDDLARNGPNVLPYAMAYLRSASQYDSFYIWRWLDVVVMVAETHPLSCGSAFFDVADASVQRLVVSSYVEYIRAIMISLRKSCVLD